MDILYNMELTFNTKLISTNQLYKKSKYGLYLSTAGKDFKHSIISQALTQIPLDFICFNCPVRVDISLNFKDRRKHDVDNIKALLDALNGILWIDDNLIYDLRITKDIGCESDQITVKCELLN